MATTTIEQRVELMLGAELSARVPEMRWLLSQQNAEGDPPYALIQADEARETTPESGVFYVKVYLLVTHALDEESGERHGEIVQAVRLALESLPRPAEDEDYGVRVYGLTVLQTTTANTAHEIGVLMELNVGCGVLEKQEGGAVYTPDVEL
jgi:hypothetical protein